MWEGIAEAVGSLLQLSADRGPRWMKVGCVVVLLIACLVLLTIGVWVPLL